MSKLDGELNEIINYLKQNTTADRLEIAKYLELSRSSVQRRIKALIAQNRIREGFIVSEDGEKDKYRFWIMISTKYIQPGDATQAECPQKPSSGDYQVDLCDLIKAELLKEEWFVDITIVSINIVFSAPWDILLSINSTNPKLVGQFIVQFLRTQPAILGTETAWSPPQMETSGSQFDHLKMTKE